MPWSNPGPAKQVIIAGPSGELLVYAGTPAFRTLIASISPVAGADPYGNNFPLGFAIFGDGAGTLLPRMDLIWDPNFLNVGGIIELSSSGELDVIGQTGLKLLVGSLGSQGIFMTPSGMQITSPFQYGNNGTMGKQYYEEFTFPATTLATGVTVTLIGNTVVKQENDYAASAYNTTTGQWTAPADGEYHLQAEFRLGNTTAAGRTILIASSAAAGGGTIYNRDDRSWAAAGVPQSSQLTLRRWLTAGTTVFFSAFQNTVAAGIATIADMNHLSFKRIP